MPRTMQSCEQGLEITPKVPNHGDWQAFMPIISNFLPIIDRLLFQALCTHQTGIAMVHIV